MKIRDEEEEKLGSIKRCGKIKIEEEEERVAFEGWWGVNCEKGKS